MEPVLKQEGSLCSLYFCWYHCEQLNLCESREDRRNVSLSGYGARLSPCCQCNALCPFSPLSLSHSNVTSRSGFRDQHKVYQEKWLLEIENDIFYPAYYRVLKILSLRYSFSSLPFARIIISRIRPALYLLAVLSERRKGHPDGSEAMGMGRIVSGID